MHESKRILCSNRAQALVEFTLLMPFLIALGLAVIEFSNIIYNYLVLTHLAREGANVTSREPGIRGSATWASQVNADLNTVVNSASAVIKTSNRPAWRVTYSMIAWNPAADCGKLSDGKTTDRFVVERNGTAPGWVNPVWTYGELPVTNNSNIGADGACANIALPDINSLTQGQTLHVIETFYDYSPNRLTPVHNFIGAVVPGTFYSRSVFMDIPG